MNADKRLPYPGLRAFRADETDLFFGRDSCTDQMVDRLASVYFLAVLGASGSGKSSLVKTGLLDALALGLLAEAGSRWQIVEMRPAGDPLTNLAAAMLKSRSGQPAEAGHVGQLAAFLRRSPRAIMDWCLAGNLPPHTSLLILADQFEELFRYTDYSGQQEAEAFVALLIETARNRKIPAYVVITMRSEFLGPCALLPDLAEMINAGLYLTRRMTRDETEDAITGPASVCDFDIEPALVNRLLNDLVSFAPWESEQTADRLQVLARRADQLPLMQHVLNRLWMQTDKTVPRVRLREADYLALGSLSKALGDHADDVLRKLAVDAGVPETIFKALVAGNSVANATRRPCQMSLLVELCNGRNGQVMAVVDAFRSPECHFLLVSPDGELTDTSIIDISHESLIRQWQTLSNWMLEEARAGEVYRDYERQAAGWTQASKWRLEDDELRAALKWRDSAHLTPAWARRYSTQPDPDAAFEATLEFVAQSQARSQRQRRTRFEAGTLLGALCAVLLTGLGVKWFEDYAGGIAEGYYSGHGQKTNYAEALTWYKHADWFTNPRVELDIGDIYAAGGYGVQQDYRHSLKWYSKAAAHGNSDAMEKLGSQYYYGEGVNRNYGLAMKWSLKAAYAGNPRAAYHLGIMFADGDGIKQDYSSAFHWYTQAAQAGDVDAEGNLGALYANGNGVQQSYPDAYEWYSKAATHGSALAALNLGDLYNNGNLGAADYSQAMTWYLKAAAAGNAEAATRIGLLFEDGNGVNQDYKQAMFWYKKADAGRDSNATNDIGALYGNGKGVKKDPVQAIIWYRKAAAQDNEFAEFNIGLNYDNGTGVPQDYGQAMDWYLKSASHGYVTAENNIGTLYYYGHGIKIDYRKALYWYQKAAENCDAVSDGNIARMYQYGDGVQRSDAQVIAYYERGAALKNDGSADDEYNLAEFYLQKNNQMIGINWLVSAANDGSADAQNLLGTQYFTGMAVGGKDYPQAMHWFMLASSDGSLDAKKHIGLMYLLGDGVKQDDQQALQWYKAGTQDSAANVEDDLGEQFLTGADVPQDDSKALLWFMRAVKDGSADAAQQVALIYLQGKGVKQSDSQAVTWFEQGLGQTLQRAENGIGIDYALGINVKANFTLALKWYKRAARDGSVLAAENLGKLTPSPSQARTAFQQAVTLGRAQLKKDPHNFVGLYNLAADLNNTGHPSEAIIFAARLFNYDQTQIFLQADMADALMMLGNVQAARTIFLKYKPDQAAGNGLTWGGQVLSNFAVLVKLGHYNPLMEEIETDFNKKK